LRLVRTRFDAPPGHAGFIHTFRGRAGAALIGAALLYLLSGSSRDAD
jgi:hypothetical protein